MDKLLQTLFPENQDIIKNLLASHSWSEYSSLNHTHLKEIASRREIASIYVIKQGHNQRLFGVKTTNDNIFPVCYLEPKGGKHDPEVYWKNIKPMLIKFLSFLAENPEMNIRKEVASAKPPTTPPKDSGGLAPPARSTKPIDRFKDLVTQLSQTTPSESASILEEMSHFTKSFEAITYNGSNFTYTHGRSSINISIKVNQVYLDILSRFAQNDNTHALTLLLVLSEAIDGKHIHYINEHFDSYPTYLQSFISEELALAKAEVIANSWCLFNSQTIPKVMPWILKHQEASDTLFGSEMSSIIFMNICHQDAYLKIFFENCNWSQYRKLSQHLTSYSEEEIKYLENNLSHLRKDSDIKSKISAKLLPFYSRIPSTLCSVLGVGLAILPTTHLSSSNTKKLSTAKARKKHYQKFTLKQWIMCFQHGLDKAEFIQLIKDCGSIRIESDHDKLYRQAIADNVPLELQRMADTDSLSEAVLYLPGMILHNNSSLIRLSELQKLISHMFHADLIDIPELKHDLASWILLKICPIDSFEYILRVYPDILQQPVGRLNAFRTLIDLISEQDHFQTDDYNMYKQKFEIGMKLYRAQPRIIGDTQFVFTFSDRYKDIVVRNLAAYNQAIKELLYPEAKSLLQRVPPNEWRGAEIWLHRESTPLSPYEYLTINQPTLALNLPEDIKNFILKTSMNQESQIFFLKEDRTLVLIVTKENDIAAAENIFTYSFLSCVICMALSLYPDTFCWEGEPPRDMIKETAKLVRGLLGDLGLTQEKIENSLEIFFHQFQPYDAAVIQKHAQGMTYYKSLYYEFSKTFLPHLQQNLREYHDLKNFFEAARAEVDNTKLSILETAHKNNISFSLAGLVSHPSDEREHYIITKILPNLYKGITKQSYLFTITPTSLSELRLTQATKDLLATAEKQKLPLLALTAAANYFDATVTLFTKYKDFVLANSRGITALHVAITQGFHRIAKLILQKDIKLLSLKGQYAEIASKWIIENEDTIDVSPAHVQSMKTLPNGELDGCRRALIRASIRSGEAKPT